MLKFDTVDPRHLEQFIAVSPVTQSWILVINEVEQIRSRQKKAHNLHFGIADQSEPNSNFNNPRYFQFVSVSPSRHDVHPENVAPCTK